MESLKFEKFFDAIPVHQQTRIKDKYFLYIFFFAKSVLYDIEDNQLVIFYVKNISLGCVVRR